ncbi:MAG: SLOG family protein [Clostridia bacterium]|nr:SLOG family protein [Clostridia bacterium]
MKKICFTGYRPHKMPFDMNEKDKDFLEFCFKAQKLIEAQIELGNKYFISGMAQGSDLVLAEIVIKLKQKYPDVFLECALPFRHQSKKWTEKFKSAYDSIINKCDKITIISEKYTALCFMQRNKYMVDCCDIVIAVYDGKKGGTHFTCQYAQKKGRQIIILNPAQDSIYCQQIID